MEDKNRKNIEEIEETVQSIVENYTGIHVNDRELNLLDDTFGIPVVDWLYVIQEIEKRFQVDLAEIIAKETFEFFTVKGIAEKIREEG